MTNEAIKYGFGLPADWCKANVLFVAAAFLLSGCAAPVREMPRKAPAEQSVHAVAEAGDLPLKLIAAEFALQRGDLATAAKEYAQASALSADPVIAEQATRLALASSQWSLARESLQRWQGLDPNAVGILQSQAWIALGEDDAEAAYTALDELVARGGATRWRPIAQTLIAAKDKKIAAGLLMRLATAQRLGNNGQDWIAMSQLAFKLDDKALAEHLSAESVKRFNSAEALAWSAQLALERKDQAAARQRFVQALKQDPENLRVRTGYAALLAETGDNAAAAGALAVGKQTDVLYGARAAYLARSNNNASLAALYREIEADKSERSGKRIYLLGQLAELMKVDSQALDWYRQVPESDERWFSAGMRIVVLSDKGGDEKRSASKLGELRLAIDPGSDEAVDLTLIEAELLIAKGKKAAALGIYSGGLALTPSEPRLLYARAMLSIDMEDLPAGEADLRTVLAANPESADALNALGYTLVDSTDRLEEAVGLIEKAIKIKPDEPAILDSYGWAQYRLGNLDKAVTLLREAYAKQPNSEIAAHLGEVLWVSGDRDEARQIWEQGRKEDAEDKVLIETIKRLAS